MVRVLPKSLAVCALTCLDRAKELEDCPDCPDCDTKDFEVTNDGLTRPEEPDMPDDE